MTISSDLRLWFTFFCKQLHLPSQPGVAKEIWENEKESCLAVVYVLNCFLYKIKENGHFRDLRLGSCLAVGCVLTVFCMKSKQITVSVIWDWAVA